MPKDSAEAFGEPSEPHQQAPTGGVQIYKDVDIAIRRCVAPQLNRIIVDWMRRIAASLDQVPRDARGSTRVVRGSPKTQWPWLDDTGDLNAWL